jgi:hypothetical protein
MTGETPSQQIDWNSVVRDPQTTSRFARESDYRHTGAALVGEVFATNTELDLDGAHAEANSRLFPILEQDIDKETTARAEKIQRALNNTYGEDMAHEIRDSGNISMIAHAAVLSELAEIDQAFQQTGCAALQVAGAQA